VNLDRKYRPKTFDGFIGNENIVKDLKAYLKTGDPPHLMFIGDPGRGKNTLAYIFATQYFGREIGLDTEDDDVDYKEFNASKDRGIDVVRNQIEPFAQIKGKYGKKRIVFLDEFDSMTPEAQMSLKSVMEKNEKYTIFILSMNNENGIREEALKSRCAMYRFKDAEPVKLKKFFVNCADGEEVYFEDEIIVDDIVAHYKGDVRKMLVDCLEALRGYDNKDNITKDDLFKIYEAETKTIAERILENTNKKKAFFDIWKHKAFNVRQFLEEIQELRDWKDSRIAAIVDANLRAGGSEKIQMAYYFDNITD